MTKCGNHNYHWFYAADLAHSRSADEADHFVGQLRHCKLSPPVLIRNTSNAATDLITVFKREPTNELLLLRFRLWQRLQEFNQVCLVLIR